MTLKQFDIQQKILWHSDRINEWLNGKVVYPITFEIDPSNVCNEKCIWCCWKQFNNKNNAVMSWELIEKIIKNMARVGVKGLIWTGGGEPFTNPNTTKGMQLAKSLGIENGLFTNGTLLDKKKIEVIIKNCTWMRVSIGAGSKETFKKCHGINQFDKVIKNIKLLVKSRKKNKSKINIGMSMMVHKENYHEIFQEAKLAKSLGVDYFQGKPLNQMGSEDHEWWFNKVVPLFKKAVRELQTDKFRILTSQYTQDKYGDEGTTVFLEDIRPHVFAKGEVEHECFVHNFVTAITANGDVAFCKNLRDAPEFYLGNLKTQSLEEIWHSDRMREVIEKMKKNKCKVFCQNNRLNQMLLYLKYPNLDNHPNFL